MNATNVLEAALGNALFLGDAFPAVTQWNVVLFASLPNLDPLIDQDLSPSYEISTTNTGYQPVRYDPGADRWTGAANPDSERRTIYRNTQTITFPTALTQWFACGFGLRDQHGQLLFYAWFTSNKTIAAGQSAVFLPGELEIAIG